MTGILVRGDPILERSSAPVVWPDPALDEELRRLHEVLAAFRREHGFGRAVAAPQLGIGKRVIALNLGATPFVLVNPEITWRSEETFELWDDCLSVPDVVVRVRRHESISLVYLDERGRKRSWEHLPRELSELVQHETDHLDGVLMTERAVGADAVRPIAERDRLVGGERREHRLSLAAIAEASVEVDPAFLHTPQFRSESLSRELGCELTLKLETANPIRSFKGRGVDFFLSRLVESGDERALACASAGNFGQALAYACRKHGRELVVYASTTASPLKIERMRALGASVRLEGEDFDAAKDAARRHCEATGARMVEDGLEPAISEGHGSIAVELLARAEPIDLITVPVGNGALISGIGRWLKASSPATRLIGVCAAGADSMEKSWRGATTVVRPSVSTIADGIAVRVPIEEAVSDMQGLVDEVVLVEDEAILEAMRLLYRHEGLTTEPAGAAALAAILREPPDDPASRVATIVTGSNIEDERIREWILD